MAAPLRHLAAAVAETVDDCDVLDVHIDAADGMAALGEVAVWAFDLGVWGECAQAATDADALARFAARVGEPELHVVERIVGADQVFERDRRPASDAEVLTTVQLLRAQRRETVGLLEAVAPEVLDVDDPTVDQPGWMPWRTPRTIALHIADHGYLKRLGLPLREPVDDLFEELERSADHTERVLLQMPRDLETSYKGEVWTSVKALRRLAWHERVEQVFLRRRLRAAGALR